MLVTHIPWTRTLSWLFRNPSDPLTNSKNITSVQQTCTGHHNNVSQGVITDTDQSGQPLESLRRLERSIYWESQFQTERREGGRPNVSGVVRAYLLRLMCQGSHLPVMGLTPHFCSVILKTRRCNLFISKIGLNRKIFEQNWKKIFQRKYKYAGVRKSGNLWWGLRSNLYLSA